MEITFRGNKLRKLTKNDKKATQKLGTRRASLYKQRLDDLRDSESLEEVRHLPGNYHKLKGDRKGQWACDLDHPFRLIFEPHEDPVPTSKSGRFVWVEIKGVEIIEIADYH